MLGFIVMFALSAALITAFGRLSPNAQFGFHLAFGIFFTLFFALMWRLEILQAVSDAVFTIFAGLFDLVILIIRSLLGLEKFS